MIKELDIDYLAVEHRLDGAIVRDVVENALSEAMSDHFGAQISVSFFAPGKFEISRREIVQGACVVSEMNPAKLRLNGKRKGIADKVKTFVTNELADYQVWKDFQVFRPLLKTVVDGQVLRTEPDGTLLVEIQDFYRTDNAIGKCSLRNQPPRERWRSYPGLTRKYYVTSIRLALNEGSPQLEIRLSRNSSSLVDAFLKKLLVAQGIVVSVQCTKRVAGAFAIVQSSVKIPKKTIKTVADELKERVVVRYKGIR